MSHMYFNSMKPKFLTSCHVTFELIHGPRMVLADNEPENPDDETIPREPARPSRPGCLPFRLLRIMMVLAAAFQNPEALTCVDAFAGKRAISKAFTSKGEPSVALDILLNPDDDS